MAGGVEEGRKRPVDWGGTGDTYRGGTHLEGVEDGARRCTGIEESCRFISLPSPCLKRPGSSCSSSGFHPHSRTRTLSQSDGEQEERREEKGAADTKQGKSREGDGPPREEAACPTWGCCCRCCCCCSPPANSSSSSSGSFMDDDHDTTSFPFFVPFFSTIHHLGRGH